MAVGKFCKKKSPINIDEQRQLKVAIEQLEKKVDCEIVLVINIASNRYLTANFQGALFGAILAFSLLQTTELTEFWQVLVYFASMAIGTLFTMVPKIKKLLIGRLEMDEEVAESAAATFLFNGLHRTTNRRGILLYLSLLERRIEILGDIGIEQVVGADFWQQLLQDFQRFLIEAKSGRCICHRKNLVQALETTLNSLGEKLAPHFPRPENLEQENQLTNWPIVE